MTKGIWRDLSRDWDEVNRRLPEALAREGFGVITKIDLQETFAAKLGVESRRYRIFGACNPKLAHEAIGRDPRVGVLLPCNVVLYERDDGRVVAGAIDPLESIGGAEGFAEMAADVRARLERVLASLDA